MQLYLEDEKILQSDSRLKQKGSYAVGFMLAHDCHIHVGRFGSIAFKEGCYFYIGSAYASGGLSARLKRHMGHSLKKHWHFDYIRPHVKLTNIYAFIGGKECHTVDIFKQRYDACFPHLKLGSSDCRKCPSHLLYYQG